MSITESICLLICLSLLALSLVLDRSSSSPATMFYGLWSIILGLDSLHLFKLLYTRDEIYSLITFGLCAFAVGYYFNKIIATKGKIKKSVGYSLRRKLVYVFAIFAIIYYIDFVVKTIPYYLSGNALALIRAMAQDSSSEISGNASGVMNAIKILFVTPFTLTLQIIVAVDWFFGNRDKKLIVLDIILMIEKIMSDGGRAPLIYLFIAFILSYLLSKQRAKNHRLEKSSFAAHLEDIRIAAKKNKRTIVLFTVVALCGIVFLTQSRNGENFLKFSYYYFSMQPKMFDLWSSIVDRTGLVTYGAAALNGFLFFVFYLIRNILGLAGYPEFWSNAYGLIEGTGTQWQTISGYGSSANSFVSAFWVLYLDGRVIGIIIGMLVYGWIMSHTYNDALLAKSSKSISLYVLLYIGLFYTFVRLQFANLFYCEEILLILFVLYRRDSLHRKEDWKNEKE